MKVAVVGAGRTGTAVAVLLMRAGHRVVAVSGRGPTRDRASRFLPGAEVGSPAQAARAGELVLVGLPDDLIAPTVAGIAEAGGFAAGSYVAHLAGSAGLDVLRPVLQAGGHRLAVHPLQTFPDVAHAIDRIPGSSIAVTADDDEGWLVGERIAADLLGEPFRLPDEMRPLYHAAAVFASNYLVAVSAIAADLFALGGVPDPLHAMHPLQAASLDNVADLGPGRALTGPIVRGDVSTVARNLEALAAHAPDVVPAYVALARLTMDLATRSGRLAADAREALEETLATWT
jgi:predicted short-subunit dehydrogenase-like oxidoreductase (DUF2520 family)